MNESPASRVYPILAFTVLLLAVAALVLKVLGPFLAAIAWAVVLGVAFRKPYAWLERRLAPRRNLAAGLATAAIAVLVLLPAAALVGAVVAQVVDAAQALSARVKSGDLGVFSTVFSEAWLGRILGGVEARTGVQAAALKERLTELLGQGSAFLAHRAGGLLRGVFDAVLTFVTTMFLLFFALRDGASISRAVSEMLPVAPDERARHLASLEGMLRAIFRGSFLAALAQGVTGGIGWAIAGLPSPVLAGAATSILSLLPVGGAALVWLPGSVYCWLSGRPGMAIFLFIWGVVVVSFLADNVLKPVLIGGQGELDTLTVFLGVFGGLAAFGLLGVFIGPMALAVFVTLANVLRDLGRRVVAREA